MSRSRSRKPRRKVHGRVVALGRGGDGVAETELGKVFVPGTFAGDEGEITISRGRSGTLFGSMAAFTVRSGDRVDAPCEHASECGGCPLIGEIPALIE